MTGAEHRAAVRELLVSLPATLFVTANFNGPADLTSGRSALRGLHARLDRRLLGRTWAKKPGEVRSLAIWLPEHVETNFHWHGLMVLPTATPEPVIEAMPKMWASIVPQGQLHIEPAWGVAGAAGYMTKEENLEHFVISTEFNA